MTIRLLLVLMLSLTMFNPAAGQKTVSSPEQMMLSYADVADLALPAPIVAEVKIRKAERLKAELAGDVVTTKRRYLVTADLVALIRGTGGLAPRISYVVDQASDAQGKWPKLEKMRMLVFALPIANRPATIRLVAPDAQQPASPGLSVLVRQLLNEASQPNAPPRIVGVGEAFHVEGSVSDEGETQIFLKAADGSPLSLSVWRRPGALPKWAVSVGEIVDEGAEPPSRDTLLWYRLACFLPPRLPASSVETLGEADAAIASEDYATVIARLGPCRRTRDRQNPARNF